MRTLIAVCAVLAGLGCLPASAAPPRSSAGLHLFDRSPPRPPRAIPHARRNLPVAAPLPRAKPEPQSQPPQVTAQPGGRVEFPPVAPLE